MEKILCMVGASFRKCTDYAFILRFNPPPPHSLIQKQCFWKAKVQFYCTGATTDFVLTINDVLVWSHKLIKNYLRWKSVKASKDGDADTEWKMCVRYERAFNLIYLEEFKKNKAWL